MESVGIAAVVIVPVAIGMYLWVLRMRSAAGALRKQQGKRPKGWN